MTFAPFSDRFYRVTETSDRPAAKKPTSPATDYASFYWGAQPAPATRSPSPVPHRSTASPPPPASHTFVSFRPATPPPKAQPARSINPITSENVTDAHGVYTVQWDASFRPTKCGYVIEGHQLVVVAEFGQTVMRHHFTLPENANLDQVTVTYKDGLFKAHAPRVGSTWKVNWLH
ncbi:hypothetical protein IWQ60_008384 [Tieghemiomyces parasiticus]|uniref:Uncharacterized protein n=1 Tax=Tieghemiomyces parasiticus TaxID=78921 RepID=A0A9W8A0F9_9FUNG|nr:hypothetical protein IWQ60_008384 [Tieghemiomyces parasiticus]